MKAEYPVSRALLIETGPAFAESLKRTFGNEAEVNLSHSARTADVQDSYSSPSLLWGFNDLFVAVLLFDFVPESRDLAAAVSRMLDNIMEGDNPAWPDKRRISEKVAFYSFIGVITINKKNIQGLSDALNLGEDLV